MQSGWIPSPCEAYLHEAHSAVWSFPNGMSYAKRSYLVHFHLIPTNLPLKEYYLKVQ